MKLQRWEQSEFGAYECSDGDWVKWDDVQELIQTLKQTRDLVEGLCEEYRDYRGLRDLEKIDKFLNNIEGQGQ